MTHKQAKVYNTELPIVISLPETQNKTVLQICTGDAFQNSKENTEKLNVDYSTRLPVSTKELGILHLLIQQRFCLVLPTIDSTSSTNSYDYH